MEATERGMQQHVMYRHVHVHVHVVYANLNSPRLCDALVEVLWLLCIVYVIRAQPAELPWYM